MTSLIDRSQEIFSDESYKTLLYELKDIIKDLKKNK
jgi:hypothetical protein